MIKIKITFYCTTELLATINVEYTGCAIWTLI